MKKLKFDRQKILQCYFCVGWWRFGQVHRLLDGTQEWHRSDTWFFLNTCHVYVTSRNIRRKPNLFVYYVKHPPYVHHIVYMVVHVQITSLGLENCNSQRLIILLWNVYNINKVLKLCCLFIYLRIGVHISCFIIQRNNFLGTIFFDCLFVYELGWYFSPHFFWHFWEAPCFLLHHHPGAVSHLSY